MIAAVGVAVIVGVLLIKRVMAGSPEGRLASGETDERLAAIGDLQLRGSDDAAKLIAEYVNDPDTRVAARAIYALGKLNRPEFAPAIQTVMSDKRPELREAAVVALTQISGKQQPADVVSAMHADQSPTVRAAAAGALGDAQNWQSMPDLLRALRDPSVDVRRRAAASVKNMLKRDMGYRPEDPPERREEAIRILEQLTSQIGDLHAKYVEMRDQNPRLRR